MNKIATLKFVAEHSVDETLKYIEEKELSKESVIEACLESRKEYGLKIQQIVELLRKQNSSFMGGVAINE